MVSSSTEHYAATAKTMAITITSEGEKVSDIQFLTLRVGELNQSLDWWNMATIWALVFAALAAIAERWTRWVTLATRLRAMSRK
jgi:hypothetical protein